LAGKFSRKHCCCPGLSNNRKQERNGISSGINGDPHAPR
jgi:hypothetical protein